MDLSIIIVNYNVKQFLRHLINSIAEATKNITAEIIIVDNASDDGSIEMLQKEYPKVTLIANKKNQGFSKANNQGMAIATGKYFLLLNPDTLVKENTFDIIIQYMETHPEIGMAGPKTLNPDGTLQLACRRGFPGPWASFCKVTGLSAIFPKSKLFAKYNLTYLDENVTCEVDAISGSFMLFRREVYQKIGGLDEQFFMYGEDLDWCYRVQQAGYKVYYIHDAQLIHYKGESTKRSNIDETRVFYEAMRLFVRKHFSAYWLVEFFLRFGISIRETMAFFSRWKIIGICILLDGIVFTSSLFVALRVFSNYRHWAGIPASDVPIVFSIPYILHIVSSTLTGTYRKDRILVLRPALATLVSFLLLTSTTYFFKDYGYSRTVVLLTYVGALLGFIFWRAVVKFGFGVGNDLQVHSKRKVLIVGTSEMARKITSRLNAQMTQFYQVVGYISTSRKEIGERIGEDEVVGSLDNLNKIVKEHPVHELIFATSDLTYSMIMEQAASLQNENIEFKIAGSDIDVLVGKREVSLLDDISLVDLTYNLSLPSHRTVKRIMDVGISIGILIILPLFFIVFPRIGKILKNAGILNKLTGVLRGKYSLVGIRPGGKSQISIAKPGVTGYWFTEKVSEEKLARLDLFYAKNQSAWLDVEILSKTFVLLFKGR